MIIAITKKTKHPFNHKLKSKKRKIKIKPTLKNLEISYQRSSQYNNNKEEHITITTKEETENQEKVE
jgi:hypothetical protein